MATGVVIMVAEKLFSVLTSQEFKDICSVFGYESQLHDLAVTVATIKGVLLDADSKHQELTHAGREYIEGLKDAVYDVDDVLDELNTMVLKEKHKEGGKIAKKVRRFFSRSNQAVIAFKMSGEIKSIREKLDNIAKNRLQFGLGDVYLPVKLRKETCSYAREESIIGRDADKEAIMGLLLPESYPRPINQDNVTFVTIVGLGGLGKTAIAQLVYNDEKIKEAFEVRMWVCVSNEFGLEHIFAKMTGKPTGLGMEELLGELRKVIEGRKYFLVLDDVWQESRNEWVELTKFLMLGGKGSRVLATTRSKAVAKAIGNYHTYPLQGLSIEDSWKLFEKMAFEEGKAPNSDMVDIGKEVVKKCANVPLAIRVIGSLLYGQHEDKWSSFKSIDFRNLRNSEGGGAEDGIMPILKYSYYHLSPSLKSCFSYCALFPKDFVICKQELIWLWMAYGCLDLQNDGQSVEAVGAGYFSILLHRGFFQDIEEFDHKTCFKMHDLIHDIALEVAGNESLVLEAATFEFDKKIRYLSIFNNGCKLLNYPGSCLHEMKKLRSLLQSSYHPSANESNVKRICSNLRRLRVLDLSSFKLTMLPNTIDNLSHLRYLDLSFNMHLEILPESITKLQNLLLLNLEGSGVRELPKGTRNLHNLRHLYLADCSKLTHMPVGIDSMTSLRTLSMFVVAGKTSKPVNTGELKDLNSLVDLEGGLEVVFQSGFSYNLANAVEGTCLLRNKVNLKNLVIRWQEDPPNDGSQGAVHEIPNEGSQGDVHEILLESLRPPRNIEVIKIWGYKGINISSWVESLATFFPCLVSVSLHGFDGLYNLPSLNQLLHLKVIELSSMPNVEFIVSGDNNALSESSSAAIDQLPLFPFLEELVLKRLPKLLGVWSSDMLRTDSHKKLANIRSFPRLHKLEIEECPCVTAFPQCPGLKTLRLLRVHKDFRFGSSIRGVSNSSNVGSVSSNLAPLDMLSHSNDDPSSDSTFYLKELWIDKVELVNLLFGESLKGIDTLYIRGFQQESLSAASDLFRRHASSLRYVLLLECYGFKSLRGGGIEHLTNVRYLCLGDSDCLDLGDGEECEPWKSLKNLIELELTSLSKLIYLPEGFQHLTSLQTLRISNSILEALPEWLPCLTSLNLLWLQSCPELKSLPEAIRHMPSLEEIRVWYCKGLTDRCREPDGQDWPKISHIPILHIKPHLN